MKRFLFFLMCLAVGGMSFQPVVRAQAAAAKPTPTPSVVPVDATGWTTPRPPYPAEFSKAKLTGAVRIRVFTDRRGNVRDAKVVGSSGHKELDDYTVKFARANWHGPALSRAVYVQNYSLKK